MDSKHELAKRHTLPGTPRPQTDIPLFDLRQPLGHQPVAEMGVDFVGPMLYLMSRETLLRSSLHSSAFVILYITLSESLSACSPMSLTSLTANIDCLLAPDRTVAASTDTRTTPLLHIVSPKSRHDAVTVGTG